ncbi:pyridoxal-phosphate dependent enzyme [Tsukamurella spumae]|uniref:Pyridoxal-phosphate dependent enzyme n=1 Tax=Tsukamurella spumae TaxID=44753 RepID=A0A846WZ37_9ACTN|nr:pyridoxal-phosphate dependent enzyme [Tsukamurella spumae]NKY18458.1 pyridoxal-phosphate dependent enzyme [Tsukamurella spumae]
MRIDGHIAEALSRPALLRGTDDRYLLRFESMKVASARAALRAALDAGRVRPGGTVIDSSSGIYAYALALACHEAGVRCRIVGSTTIDEGLRVQLLALGVDLEQMPRSASLKLDQDRRVRRITELLAQDPALHWMRQYHDPVHYRGYRDIARGVASELAAEGAASVRLVAPVGSGVSSGALRLGFEEAGLAVELVGVQPFGSVTFGAEHVEDPAMLIAGIGSSIPFDNVRHGLYEVIHWVSFEVARAGTLRLLREHAIFAGLSSGAGHAAADFEQAHGAPVDATVQVLPDTGHRYLRALADHAEDTAPAVPVGPRLVDDPSDIALPWARMRWSGRDGA